MLGQIQVRDTELQKAKDELEKRVEERTAELEQEITDRKRADEALRESEERTRLLLDSTAEAIYGVDMRGNCTFCNPATLRLFLSSPHQAGWDAVPRCGVQDLPGLPTKRRYPLGGRRSLAPRRHQFSGRNLVLSGPARRRNGWMRGDLCRHYRAQAGGPAPDCPARGDPRTRGVNFAPRRNPPSPASHRQGRGLGSGCDLECRSRRQTAALHRGLATAWRPRG
ncbi:MAG: hypothetical protein DMG29_18215 [Acidobacteria bacterium]|nr:MAG: hypothetical protein DMG29_18215 [Acidobacteriota bacterium]